MKSHLPLNKLTFFRFLNAVENFSQSEDATDDDDEIKSPNGGIKVTSAPLALARSSQRRPVA
jgi:hypothetical protein